jgi:histidinol-phosphate aminotransferase
MNRFPLTRFIVDEAYHEFATPDPERGGKPLSCAQYAMEHENLIVTRTFSKAFCLASVRCGYLVAHPNTVEQLRCFYNPKSVNQFAQVAATQALAEFAPYYAPYIKLTNDSRTNFIADLRKGGVDARSGGAGNFVCIEIPGGKTKQFCAELEKQSIYVRDISGRFPGYVRITVGLDMSKVVTAVIVAMKHVKDNSA